MDVLIRWRARYIADARTASPFLCRRIFTVWFFRVKPSGPPAVSKDNADSSATGPLEFGLIVDARARISSDRERIEIAPACKLDSAPAGTPERRRLARDAARRADSKHLRAQAP
jgi:hypothetical protein